MYWRNPIARFGRLLKLIALVSSKREVRVLISAYEQAKQNDLNERLGGTWKLLDLVDSHTLVGLSGSELQRLFGLYELVKTTSSVKGDVVECGVGFGKTLLWLAAIVTSLGLEKRIHGFDSFAGFPEPSPEDASPRNPKKGQWGGGSEYAIYTRFALNGMAEVMVRRVVLHRGYFAETLPASLPEKISFLHLDCDLYQSYRDSLEYGYPRCQPGAVILFDEYNVPQWPGATKAVDEFFADKPEQIKYFEGCARFGVIKEEQSL